MCYQCQKCTSGCPVAFAMDIVPHRLMHFLHLGLLNEVLRSDTIWICASCETCSTRCPNNIDIATVMDTLRQMSLQSGMASQKNARLFNKEFLGSVRQHGRIHELRMITAYTVKSKGLAGFLKQREMGRKLFARGKLKLLPHSLKGNPQVKTIFSRAEKEEQK